MDTSPTIVDPLPAPNHHADHLGFSGPRGLFQAVFFLFGRRDAAELAIDLARLRPDDHVVDIGCGPGDAAQRAGRIGAEVVGVDPAPVMLRVARLRWWRRRTVDWRVGTAEAVPVGDGWANVVWSLATVHHWADIDAGLHEASRVLAAGGRLVVVERRIERTDAEGRRSHGWTSDQAQSFAEQCRRHGFVDIAVGEHPIHGTALSVVARRP